MQQFVIKEKIEELLKNRKVIAALFHTFNFDPVFFENYVMPLFVPEKSFSNEMLYNKILWRNCMKDGLMPAITVFCDYYAKDNSAAPGLGYDVFCVRTPAVNGAICNFHPKNIFILTEDGKGQQVMLLLTGSGNLTPGGWCDNLECFSVLEIKKDRSYPNKTTTNALQDYISEICQVAGVKKHTDALHLVYDFLRYADFDMPYFSSVFESFPEFLDRTVFEREDISEVEIISPYFATDTLLLDRLKAKSVKKIRCLIPTLRNDEVQMDKQAFVLLQESGVKWCDWKKSGMNEEVRNLHAKVYRFYGYERVYTVIGSVNFTHPAWRGYAQRNNQANIESGILYREHTGNAWLQERKHIDVEALRFYEKESLENAEGTAAVRNAPDLQFTIDWAGHTLQVVAKITAPCRFVDLLNEHVLEAGKYVLPLDDADMRVLTKNSLIRIVDEEGKVYCYYAQHLHFEVKPLDFRLDAATILKYWQYFDEPFMKDLMSRQLAEQVTDESGVMNEQLQVKDSLLNIMATHFVGLISLERKLFGKLSTKGEQRAGFGLLKYYLLAHNIDTLRSYWLDIEQQMEEGKIQKSFFWMISQILLTQFYKRALKWEYRSEVDPGEWKFFREAVQAKITQIQKSAATHTRDIKDFDMAKREWAIEQFTTPQ